MSDWTSLRLVCPRCRGALGCGGDRFACASCGSSFPIGNGVLDLRVGRHGRAGFDPHYFTSLERVEGEHFWFVSRRETVLQALRRTLPDLGRRRLFDIGCGTWSLLAFLNRSGVRVAGACDAYPESLAQTRRRLALLPLVLVDEGRLPPLASGQDLLGMFDVLEHIDDDVGTLAALAETLVPGGALVLTVPAHPSLFDEMDEAAGHRRRYTRAGLYGTLAAAGLEVSLISHFMSPLAPLVFVGRRLERLLPRFRKKAAERWDAELRILPGINGALRRVLALERAAMRVVSPPLGSSLIAVALRPR